MNKYTLEIVPHIGTPIKRHFRHENAALLSFHVQRQVADNRQVILWDNRAGEACRQWGTP